MKAIKIILIGWLFILMAAVANATIIIIPGDYLTIQEGINAATDGDTVLVHPEIYVENINYNGKNITVASLLLTTQDTIYISQTIIDGNQNGSVVSFISGEDSLAVLTGFTLKNGSGTFLDDIYLLGGGIYCNESSPTICYNIIRENSVENYWCLGFGGGIYCFNASPKLQNLEISDNYADCVGGGLSVGGNSQADVRECLISENSAPKSGGGISCSSYSTFSNCKIINNSATGDGQYYYYGFGGGIYFSNSNSIFSYIEISDNQSKKGSAISFSHNSYNLLTNLTITENGTLSTTGDVINLSDNSNITIINSIIYSNDVNTIRFNPQLEPSLLNISYSDIEGGEDAFELNDNGVLNYLEGNIDLDPLFENPVLGNYHLQNYSPCIDAGDPFSPIDPDGTISDMGAYYFYHYCENIVAEFSSDIITGYPALSVSFYDESLEFNTEIISWQWDLNGDGSIDSEDQNPFWEYSETGQYTVSLTISDGELFDTIIKENYIFVRNDNILYISTTGSNIQGDGSYENPFQTIQYGINWSIDNDTILVYPGTYYENINLCGNKITLGSFFLTSQDSSYIEYTIINGNQTGSVITCNSQEDSTAIITGFTITNGSGTYTNILEGYYQHYGAGVYCVNSSPKFENLIITLNSTPFNNGIGGGILCYNSNSIIKNIQISNNTANYAGGGIACLNNSNPLFESVVICNNYANFIGGGIYLKSSNPEMENIIIENNYAEFTGGGISCKNCSPAIRNSIIRNNHSEDEGGGLDCYQYCSPQVTNTLFINNISRRGGAINCRDSSNAEIRNVQILSNTANHFGGGIHIRNSSPLLENIIFEGNTSVFDGGAIYICDQSSPELIDIKIRCNQSETGAGIACINSNLSLTNSKVLNNNNGNNPNNGGGLDLYNSTATINKTLIAMNSAQSNMGLGGGIKCQLSNISLISSTISGNTAVNGGAIYCMDNSEIISVNSILWENSPQQIFFCSFFEPNTVTAGYNDIENGINGIVTNNNGTINWLAGNINIEPLFIDPSNEDFHLSQNSPCIDAGTPYFEWQGEVLLDLNPEEYYGVAPDMGAYEYCFVNADENYNISHLKSVLFQNYPNPFNPNTTISFNISRKEATDAKIEIYNIKGQKIKTFSIPNSKFLTPNSITWDGMDENGNPVSSGIYFYQLQIDNKIIDTKKCLVLK